jgi:hypothetical protein
MREGEKERIAAAPTVHCAAPAHSRRMSAAK